MHRDVLGLAALDFILRIVLARVMGVPLVVNVFGMHFDDLAADSDQFARLFRSHLAQDSEMISPRVPISNRPGTRFFQHVSFWHR
jgi:hypothetical protein